jgi:hypothetical protein
MTNNYTDNNKTQEMLNALADGQLPAHEREKILSMIDKDPKLSSEVCEIYRIKDLIKTAYPLDEFKSTKVNTLMTKFGFSIKVASAFFAFILTLSAGYYLAYSNQAKPNILDQITATQKQENKIIVFLSSSEPAKFTQALYQAETLAVKHQQDDGEVYVVTSAEGIDLLNRTTTPYQQKIMRLSNQYPHLKFVACNNTLYLREKQGKPINLVAEAEIAPSAVDFVATHLLKGWQYVSI